MKVVCQMKGYFERSMTDGTSTTQVSLPRLIQDLRGIATTQHRYQSNTLHRSFGLDFLPRSTFEHLLEQIEGKSPFIASGILHPVSYSSTTRSESYLYYFQTENFRLGLSPEDPQIPQWSGDRCEGIYYLEIQPTTTHLFHQQIHHEALEKIRNLPALEILHAALRSPSYFGISLRLTDQTKVTVWQTSAEIDPIIQEAILCLNSNLSQPLSDEAKQLVENYKRHYRIPDQKQSPQFRPSSLVSSQGELIVGWGLHRQVIENIIKNAQEFIAISSFRLEDLQIAELIASRAKELPQGVWILTDLGREVLNRVDTNVKGQYDHEDEYLESDRKKRECLQLLVNSGAFIRSGLFHAKIYLTDRQAYLGSCNLTGGSLNRNGEAGVVWQQTAKHQQLFEYFYHLWKYQTNAEIFASPLGVTSLGLSNRSWIAPVDGFLNYFEYQNDLQETLKQWAKKSRGEVRIFTRSFRPTFVQQELLGYIDKLSVFYGLRNDSIFPGKFIQNLHAKIVLFGDEIAYVSSQDFVFLGFGKTAHDLTYKTTNPQEIKSLWQLSKNLI